MPTVEIDETELVNYRNIAGAVHKMLGNPKTRSMLLAAQKEINPNAIIPELDAAKPVMEALAKQNEELAALRKQREDDRAELETEKKLNAMKSQWEAGRAKARRVGYTAEGIQQLEAFMEEKGVADHEVAMPAFEKLNPPASAVDNSASGKFDVKNFKNDGDDMKALLEGDEQGFLNKRINETLAGIRSGNL